MQNQIYEKYINTILGYPNTLYYNNLGTKQLEHFQIQRNNRELENLYPEIYKIIYPMILKAIRNNSEIITKTKIDSLTNEIYDNIEGNSETKPQNDELKDLIKILLIRELMII